VARHVEVELVALDLYLWGPRAEGAGGCDNRASWRGRGEVPNVNLVANRRLARRQQVFHRFVARVLHWGPHAEGAGGSGRGRKDPIATHVPGDEPIIHDALELRLETRADAVDCRHALDCR
jgi:hypothetical protein